jgi:hypothetical protein
MYKTNVDTETNLVKLLANSIRIVKSLGIKN